MAEQKYRYHLTTIDNPFDPFDQHDAWLLYDMLNNYDTPGLFAQFANTAESLSDELNEEERNEAITRVIVNDPLNIYIRVRKPIDQPTSFDTED